MTRSGVPPRRPAGPLRAVLFDLDGVLADTFDVWCAVLDRCRRRRGLPPLGPDRVREVWGQGLRADCETLFPGESPARLAREYEEAFVEEAGRVRPVPGAEAALLACRKAGRVTGVVTNSPAGMAEAVLRQLRFRPMVDVLATGDEVLRGKPDPALLFVAVARAGVNPGEAALVGDTPLDIAAARAAGVLAVGYRVPGDITVDELARLPDRLGLPR